MRTIKGPGVFLAQFIAPVAPYDRLATLAAWAAEKGYAGVQVPTFNPAIFDLAKAAESKAYCDEVKGLLAGHGLEIFDVSDPTAPTELGNLARLGTVEVVPASTGIDDVLASRMIADPLHLLEIVMPVAGGHAPRPLPGQGGMRCRRNLKPSAARPSPEAGTRINPHNWQPN